MANVDAAYGLALHEDNSQSSLILCVIPSGNGTATFDHYEMRVHRRILDIPADDRILHPIMKLQIPRSVQIKIEMKE